MASRLSGAILAAGHGQRLRSAAGGLPKPLVQLGGQSLLFRQIALLIRAGVSPIHVIVNSETARLMDEHSQWPRDSAHLLVADTPNSMESLLKLGEHIAPGLFVLMTVDAVLAPSEVEGFVTDATKIIASVPSRFDGVLGVVKWRGDTNPLFAQVADDGMIVAFGEQQARVVTAGIYLFSTAIFAHAAEARRRELGAMRRFLAMLLEKHARFAAYELARAVDVDDAADLQAAREMLAGETEPQRS